MNKNLIASLVLTAAITGGGILTACSGGSTANNGGPKPSTSPKVNDISEKLKVAQQQWLKTRDADCAVEAFPATSGSQAFTIAQNDCIARMSDERSEFLESIAQE